MLSVQLRTHFASNCSIKVAPDQNISSLSSAYHLYLLDLNLILSILKKSQYVY